MTEEKIKLLKQANIKESDYDKCFITDSNEIFMPYNDKTGKEVYEEWIKNKNKEPQQTTEEKMLKEIANLKIDNTKKDSVINNTLKTVAELKVQVMTLKGGN